MSFQKKLDMILEARKLERLSINKIERLLGVDGTIYKAHKADKYPVDSELVLDMLRKLGVRREWWEKEWETGSNNIFTTSVQNPSDNKEKTLEETIEALLAELRESNKYLRSENDKLNEFNERLRADLRNATDQALNIASVALAQGKKK